MGTSNYNRVTDKARSAKTDTEYRNRHEIAAGAVEN